MARVLKRGDIVWATLDPVIGHKQAGMRSVLVISDEILNRHSGTVIAMAITSREPRASFPLTYPLSKEIGRKLSWVKITQIRTLSTERLGKTIGHVSDSEMETILEGLNEALGN